MQKNHKKYWAVQGRSIKASPQNRSNFREKPTLSFMGASAKGWNNKASPQNRSNYWKTQTLSFVVAAPKVGSSKD